MSDEVLLADVEEGRPAGRAFLQFLVTCHSVLLSSGSGHGL